MGHQHITCLGSQFLVPAVSHRMSATGMQRDWGLTSSDNSHRANRWCFSPLTYSCVHFRGQKGGPVNPVSFKYSSPSKVNAPAKPVGQEKAEGGRDVGLWGGTQMGSTTPVGLVLPFALTAGQSSVLISLLEQWKQVPAFLVPRVLAASQGSETMLSLLTAAAKHRVVCLLL